MSRSGRGGPGHAGRTGGAAYRSRWDLYVGPRAALQVLPQAQWSALRKRYGLFDTKRCEAAGNSGGSTRRFYQRWLRGWVHGKIDEWNKDTLCNIYRGLQLTNNDDGCDAVKGITTAASSTGLLGCTRLALLALVLLYHLSACDSDAAVLLVAPCYPTKRLLWDLHSIPRGVTHPGDDNVTLLSVTS